MTQKQLGVVLSVGNTAISQYEGDKRQIEPGHINKLCDLFGCTADYLLGRSDVRTPAVSEEDAAVLEAYHALPPELRRAVDGILEPYRAGAERKRAAS